MINTGHAWSLKRTLKKVKREAKKAVKKVIHKPAKFVTEIAIAPTVAVVSVVTDPKKTIKDPLKTMGHKTSDAEKIGSKVFKDVLNTGLSGLGEAGSEVEEFVEPFADEVSVGGGLSTNSDGEVSLTDGSGNIVEKKPINPNDMNSESFDWESAIAASREGEVDDFIKAEQYLENSKYFRDLEIEEIRDLNENLLGMANKIGNSSMEGKKLAINKVLEVRNTLLRFSKGEATSIDLRKNLLGLQKFIEEQKLRGPASLAFWVGIGVSAIPVVQFGINVKRFVQTDNRIGEIIEYIDSSKIESRAKNQNLRQKLGVLRAKLGIKLVINGTETLAKLYTFSLSGRVTILKDQLDSVIEMGKEEIPGLILEMSTESGKKELDDLLKELK